MLLRRGERYGFVLLALMAVLVLAPAAWAHSALLSTEPARDRVVEHSPDRVLMRFDEPVETALGSIAVYDGEGERVDAGKILRPRPQEVAVRIDHRLERGTYTVAWRVISADSDPINGAWVFHVKAPGPQPSGIAAQVLEDTPFVVSALYLGGRFLDFALLLFCAGGAAALAIALRYASEGVRRRLFGVLAAAAAGLTAIALIGLGLQGAAAGGAGLGEGFQWDSISSVADTRFGHFSFMRAGLAAALCVVALVARANSAPRAAPAMTGRASVASDGDPVPTPVSVGERAGVAGARASAVAQRTRGAERTRQSGNGPVPSPPAVNGGGDGARAVSGLTVVTLLLALGLIVTPGLSGHASVSGPVSLVADAAHVQAAAVWTGGLAFVVLGLLFTAGKRWELAAATVPRFSMMAVVSVTVLLVAGAINGYLQVRAWRGLWETQYGVLLLIKIGLVLPLLAIGAYNNRFAVPRLRAQIASVVERRRFLRFAGAELVIMLAIVGVTAGLVNAPPARTEVEMDEASETELRMGPFMAHMEVMPAQVGPNEIHLEFTKGRPDEVNISARSEDIGPLRYRARRAMEPGTYVVKRANLSPGGEWELRIDVRRGEFDLFSDRVHLSIDKEL